MKSLGIPVYLSLLGFLTSCAWAQTATYTSSNQSVTLTGLGGSGGVGQSRVTWGNCVFNGSNTVCTVTAPYTGVGGPGTINMIFTYSGNGISPFTANSISAGSNLVTFGLVAGSSGSITVSLTESSGKTVTFLGDNFTFYFTPAATCSGTAVSSCAVGVVGVTPGAVITGPVFGTFDATPVIRTGGVISASGYGGFSAIAPGTWIEIYGTNLANVTSQFWTASDFNGTAAPTGLGQTTVTVGGLPAYVYYVSPGQLDVQVPSNVPTGNQPVVVTDPGGVSLPSTVVVNPTEPGLLAPALLKLAAGQYVAALYSDGTTYVLPPGAVSGLTSRRAVPNDIIILIGIGFGPVIPNIPAGQIVTQSNQLSAYVHVSIGGVPATVQFAGLTADNVGLYQFNVVVPNVPAGDSTPLTFTLGSNPGAQTLLIPIGPH